MFTSLDANTVIEKVAPSWYWSLTVYLHLQKLRNSHHRSPRHVRLDSATSPKVHAFRGISAALVALTALANLTGNRQAFLALLRRGDLSRLKLASPSRNGLAFVVFIGWL